MQLNVEFQIAT